MNFTSDIESLYYRIKSKYTANQRLAFITVLLVGILAHGFIIFNRISYHDNTASLFSLGATYELGRWGLGIIFDLQKYTTRTFSVPVFNGIISLVFIAFATMKFVEIFDIKSKAAVVITSAIMIAYPTVPSIFSFMFTSWPYFLGLLLSVCSAQVITKKLSLKSFIISSLLLACSLGLYQAFFAVTISILLMKLTVLVLNDDISELKNYVITGTTFLGVLLVGLVEWKIISVVFTKIRGIDITSYRGIGEKYDITKFPVQLKLCLKEFFTGNFANINGLKYLRLLAIVVIAITIVQILMLLYKKDRKISLMLFAIIGVCLLPIGMNVTYLLSTSDSYFVDSLMVYSDSFVLVFPWILIEILQEKDVSVCAVLIKCITWLQIVAILVITVSYIYLDNAAYLKADIAEKQVTSYFTQLAANIKSCDGFTDDMEVVLVDFDKNKDKTIVSVDDDEQLQAIKIERFPIFSELVIFGSSIDFMREHCGFGNELVYYDDGTMAANNMVKDMPCYPDDGSIKVVDGKVVVKFGD